MDARGLKILLADAASRLVWHLSLKKLDTGDCILVLCYHRVLPDFIEAAAPIYTILPEQFEQQLAFLAAEGFVSLSLSEYAEIARGLSPAPRRSVVITFDDGYGDTYHIAWNIAKKYQITINLFFSTGFVGENHPLIMTKNGYILLKNGAVEGKDRADILGHIRRFPELWRPLTWEELRKMHGAGVDLGFHSHSHRNLGLLPSAVVAADIVNGLEIFERRLGYRPVFFPSRMAGMRPIPPRQ